MAESVFVLNGPNSELGIGINVPGQTPMRRRPRYVAPFNKSDTLPVPTMNDLVPAKVENVSCDHGPGADCSQCKNPDCKGRAVENAGELADNPAFALPPI